MSDENVPERDDAVSAADALLGAARAALAGADKVLRAYKLESIADLAASRADRDRQMRSVVVVGELKRGKSSLVNALVGIRDLSPIGVDVTTTIPISICPATDPPLDGTIDLLFPDRLERVPLTTIADWVTVDGRHVCDASVESLPTRVNIPITRSRLGEVMVIDTPGVGGLDPVQSALVTRSAEQACVVVIVSDASSPLTAPEMEFIDRAGASVDGLILAVTKTDKNIRRWKPIVEDNRRLLREHLDREVTVIGVSSLLASMAADAPDGPDRDRLEISCGIAELRAEIHRRLDVAGQLPIIDALRTSRGGLTTLRERIGRDLEAVRSAEAALPDLTAKLARLELLKEQSREWEQFLARDLTAMRQQAMDASDRRLEEIRSRWTERINKSGMEVLRKSPQKFTADMEAELQKALMQTVSEFLEDLRVRVVEPKFSDPAVWEQISNQIAASLGGQSVEGPAVASKRHGIFDPTIVTMGIMGSSSIAGVIGLSSVLGIGAVVGAVWVSVNLGFRAMRSGKTNLLNWLRETIGITKTVTARLLEIVISQARPEIVVGYRDYLRTGIDELQAQIKSAKESAVAGEAKREKDIARLTSNSAIIDKRIAEIERVSVELAAVGGVA